MDNIFNITELTARDICGKCWSNPILNKVLKRYNVEVKHVGGKNSRYYDLDDVTKACESYLAEKGKGKDTNISNLKETKLLKEIEMLRANIQKAETATKISTIQLDQLKKTSVQSDEVKEFLMLRYGIENAILRQILFVNAPVDLVGVEITKARDICETYYNQIQDVMHETMMVWQQKCLNEDTSQEWPDKIKKVIQELTDKLNVKQDNPTSE